MSCNICGRANCDPMLHGWQSARGESEGRINRLKSSLEDAEDRYDAVYTELTRLQANLKARQWVSIKDNIPTAGRMVELFDPLWEIYSGCLDDDGWWVDRNGDRLERSPTHWRYIVLPEMEENRG